MNGRSGVRGYQIQALVCLLDGLDPNNDWDAVTIEPDLDTEKVDILWESSKKRRAIQVKSSRRHITLASAKIWAKELTASSVADDYELRLVGPIDGGIAKTKRIGKVKLPTPEPENVQSFLHAAAHRLDRFLQTLPTPIRLSPDARELIVDALANRLITLSGDGKRLVRSELEQILVSWVAELQSSAASKRAPLLPSQRNTYFVGRDDLLQTIRTEFEQADLRHSPGVQVLAGLGGVGKTQVALEYAYRHVAAYEHIFFITGDSARSILDGFTQIAGYLGLVQAPGKSSEEISVLTRKWLATNDGWLLIIDNADDVKQLKGFEVQRAGAHCLVTTRDETFDALGGPVPLRVDVLGEQESRDFLLKRTGARSPSEVELAALAGITKELCGLPLALEQAAAYIKSRKTTFASYLTALRDRRLEVLERMGPNVGGYALTVARTWKLNIEAVETESPASADVLRLSAFLYPDNIPCEFLVAAGPALGDLIEQALAGVIDNHDITAIDELLLALTRYSLIQKHPDGMTYSLHRLVQDVVLSYLDHDSRTQWKQRLLIALSSAFPALPYSFWNQCARLLPHVLTVYSSCDEGERLTVETGTLLHRVGRFLEEQGDYSFALSAYTEALTVRERVLGPNHADFGTTLNNLALTLHRLGRYADAISQYERALTVRSQALSPDHPDVAQTHSNLGLTLAEVGRLDEAERCYQSARSVLLRAGREHLVTLAACLNNLAGLMHVRGKKEEAEKLLAEALTTQRQVLEDSDPRVTATMKNIAQLRFERGDRAGGIALIEGVISIEAHSVGKAHPQYAQSLHLLAGMLATNHEWEKAEQAYREAGQAAIDSLGAGHPFIGVMYINLAHLYSEQGKMVEAIRLNEAAVKLLESAVGPSHLDTATAVNNLAYLRMRCGDADQAKPLFERVLTIREGVLGRTHHDVATVLGNIALILDKMNDSDGARSKYNEALAMFEELGAIMHTDAQVCVQNYLSFLQRAGNQDKCDEIRRRFKIK